MSRPARERGAARTLFGIGVGVGALVMVAAVTAAAALTPDDTARLLLVAAAVGGHAALSDDTSASVATAVLGYLLFRGFLIARYGELTWDPANSLWHLLVFAFALGLGLGQRWIRATVRRGDR